MIHLLQPLWLCAMAAIAAPVILHFWNDRSGKVLRIGSISLLKGASQRMAWSRRLSQRWLLLLRCVLLAVLAVFLAGPYWRPSGGAGPVKGWVLEDAAVAAAVTRGEAASAASWRVLSDSLAKAGWERHILGDSLNYWNGLRAADSAAPAGAPFYVVTTGLVRRFSGERPSTARDIHWDIFTPADSVRHWIAGAWMSGPDSVRMINGLSRSTGTVYREATVARDSHVPVEADTSALRVAVCSDPANLQDGRYIAASLRALQQYTRRRMQIDFSGRPPAAADWLFWLSVRPIPAGSFSHVLCYVPGRERVVDTRVDGIAWMKEVDGGEVRGSAAGREGLWRDGFGRAMLREKDSLGRRVHQFYSRFDPDWNDLVWSRSLPVMMEKLLFGEDTDVAEDRRVIDPAQVVSVRGREGTGGDPSAGAGRKAGLRGSGEARGVGSREAGLPGGSFDLKPAVWWLVLLLFITERVVSHGKRKT